MKKIKAKISIILLLFINFAFAVKYLSRITPYYILISILILLFYTLLWKNRSKLISLNAKFKYIDIVLLVIFIGIISVVFIKIPCQSLNVDRWSVISSFWDNYFRGDYVYFAKSHMGNPPGPMPFYFILALPFYLFGELGYFSVLGIILFWYILKYNLKPNYIQTIFLLLTMSSLFYLWEVVSRSNLFLNASLILFSIIYLFKSLEKKLTNYILLNGFIIGLLLSTRNVFVIPYIITFLFLIKHQLITIKSTIFIAVVSLITFFTTFIPFIYNHLDVIKVMNPFIIQSSFLMPTSYSIFCVFFSLITIYFSKQKRDVYFYSGLLLFLTISLHFVYFIKKTNFNEAFFNSRADISYFILCTPFLIYYILECDYFIPLFPPKTSFH